MSDREPPRDIWKEPPQDAPVEEEVADSPALAAPDDPEAASEPESSEQSAYAPRHRAAGRAPLIRRRRIKPDDPEDDEVTWETSSRSQDESAEKRWVDQEESSIAPPQRPLEELPYLGPRRTERRRKRPSAEEESSQELIRRTRDYTGRHLAPKKPVTGSRGSEGDVEELADRSEIDRIEPRENTPPPVRKTFVEGDVREEPGSGLFARPWRSRRTGSQPTLPEEAGNDEPAEEDVPTDDPVLREQTAPDDDTVAPAVEEVSEPASSEPELAEPESSDPAHPVPAPREAPVAPQVDRALSERDPAAAGATSSDPPEPLAEGEEDLPPGPRTAALQERKKKKKVRQTAGGVLAIAGAIVAAIVVGMFAKQVVEEPKGRVAVPFEQPAPEPEGGTTLLFGTREDAGAGRGAIWMTLFAYDAENEKASIVYIPPHTAVEVPGRGLQGVGEAYGSGGIPLLLVATENLLGVSIDRYVELSDKDAFVFFEGLDSLTVDVPAEVRVPAGRDQARLIFVDGPQELTPELLVRLLYIVGIDGDDVELGSRHLAFWDALFDTYDDPDEVAELIEEAGAAFGESDASVEDHAAFFGSIAELAPERLTITALPVRPISAGDAQLYATDEDELAEFVAATIGAGRDRPAEIRVQVLNGNGVPGIGQEVASRLVGEGFRVILSGNARRLNYRETLVIAYDSSDEGIALAERARELLGVGEVQVSAQQQGIVDLTIVVGKDFLRAR